MIMENALKMAVVGPAKVMILSGQLPSEMLMRAPLYRQKEKQIINRRNVGFCSKCSKAKLCKSATLCYSRRYHMITTVTKQRSHLFSHFLHRFTFLLAENQSQIHYHVKQTDLQITTSIISNSSLPSQ